MAQRVDARDVSASMAAVGLEQFLLFIGLAEHIPLFTAEYRDLDHLVDCAEVSVPNVPVQLAGLQCLCPSLFVSIW